MKYTIEQFRKDYPNDAVCLDKLFTLRYGKMEACPKCGVVDPIYKRITTRRSYQCRDCYNQVYPTAGTIFEKSTTPLTYWFYAMYLMTVTRNGVSAKELERVLGVTYKTAWRMAREIRTQMGRKKKNSLFGIVECDETYVGGEAVKANRGRSNDVKTPVFAMFERRGNVVAQKVPDTKKATLFPIIEATVSKSSKVMTDEYKTYTNLGELGYDHKTILHQLKKYVDGEVSTNTVEGFFSQVKRMIRGTHIWVSDKHIQKYLDECCFRYNNRSTPGAMFDILFTSISS
jgi:transposase